MLKTFLSVLLFFPYISFTQTISNTGSKVSPDDAQAVLEQHNKARSDLGIPPLTWSAEVAAYAQQWADYLAGQGNCALEHNDNRSKGYGENLYAASSAEAFKPLDASLAWYNEIKDYTYSKLGDGNWQKTSHYTQMIWKNTTALGMGVATCANGGVVVVANYNPAGNYSGEYPY